MPKYSTGGGGGDDDGDACELCGRETGNLQRANVAGARLLVCSNCRPHDDSRRGSGGGGGSGGGRGGSGSGGGGGSGSPGGADGSDGPRSRTQEIANKQAKMYDAATGDSSHWEEEGTNYEADRLPYLVSGYGDVTTEARQEAGLTVEELAAELGIDEDDLLAIEDGRAATAGVGGSVVRAVAERLDVTLVDE
jgi:ribosome-binding protein aMBF1 (putative translation factor)